MKKAILALIAAIGMALSLLSAAPLAQSVGLQLDAKGNLTDNSTAVYYGWKWAEVVDVYDATGGNPSMKVAQAAAEWEKRSGYDTRMTHDPAQANIVVSVADTACGVGCAYFPPVTDGIASGTCQAVVLNGYQNMPVTEHIVIHELGHCAGLAHAPETNAVMYWSVSAGNFYKTPQSYDYKDMKALYGR